MSLGRHVTVAPSPNVDMEKHFDSLVPSSVFDSSSSLYSTSGLCMGEPVTRNLSYMDSLPS